MRQLLGILAIGFLCFACTKDLRLVDLNDGSMIAGSTSLWGQRISLTLPSGDIAEGGFIPLSSARIDENSLFHHTNLGALFGGHISGRFHGYAHLMSADGTVVEIIFSTDWLTGVGFARTNQGREFRFSF